MSLSVRACGGGCAFFLSVSLAAVFLSAASARAGQEQDNTGLPVLLNPDVTLTVQTFPLNIYEPKLDGQWQGSRVASDGKVYFGSSTHAHDTGGLFAQYDPVAGQVSVLAQDISYICGEDPKVQVPQGKLHSDVVELDGWLYFSTHLANYWSPAIYQYTGSHVVGYRLGSLEAGAPEFRDLGVTHGTSYSSYSGIAVDPVRNYLYNYVTPWTGGSSYVYRFNLSDPNNITKGIVGTISGGPTSSQWHYLDSDGDLWFTMSNQSGRLYKVTGSTGVMTSYANVLPLRRDTESDVENTNTSYRYWRWGQPIGGDKFVFNMNLDGGLWEFDASRADDGDLSDAFTQINWLGLNGLDMCLGGDTVYFLQAQNPDNTNPAKASDHHLKSVCLDPYASVIDWGRVIDQDGRTPWRAEGMSADEYGNVYLTGDWRLLTDANGDLLESGTVRHNDSVPGTYFYDDMWRGQFFAVAAARNPIFGDTNNDGRINTGDADLLWALFGTSVPPSEARCDLTGDGQVTFADAQELVQVVLGTSMADTDLDRYVGLADLGNLANRYNQTGVFSDGDTDGDGLINLLDLGNLANDYGKTFSHPSPPVPEPASAFLLLVGLPLALRRRAA